MLIFSICCFLPPDIIDYAGHEEMSKTSSWNCSNAASRGPSNCCHLDNGRQIPLARQGM